jgi:hypothetical protein
MCTPRIGLPRSARPGEVIAVRTPIDHPMVTAVSGPGPRDAAARFEATPDGETVLAFDFANTPPLEPDPPSFCGWSGPARWPFAGRRRTAASLPPSRPSRCAERAPQRRRQLSAA